MPDDKIKLPRSSYEELCKIIKAYGRLTGPTSLDEVSSLCAIRKSGISANVSFLVNIGIIQGGRFKEPTEMGKELANALVHNIPNQIQKKWEWVVKDNEFLEKMRVAVEIRGRWEISALESHIAYSAGEAKSKQVMTGARTVVDILRAAGVIREHDGQMISKGTLSSEFKEKDVKIQDDSSSKSGIVSAKLSVPREEKAPINVMLRIDLRIDAKVNELDGLGGRLRDLLRDLEAEDQATANINKLDE